MSKSEEDRVEKELVVQVTVSDQTQVSVGPTRPVSSSSEDAGVGL